MCSVMQHPGLRLLRHFATWQGRLTHLVSLGMKPGELWEDGDAALAYNVEGLPNNKASAIV